MPFQDEDHLIIAGAAWPQPEYGAPPPVPRLPQLKALVSLADGPPHEDRGAPDSLSTPFERTRARVLGLAGADGCLPWAAWMAQGDGLDTDDLAWGLLTPTHWQVGSDWVLMHDPADLALDEATSRELMESVRFLFEDEGWVLTWGAPLRWYVAHESLAGFPTASLERVIGRPVGSWLPQHASARLLRRLQNEVQMLLYDHPVNNRREAAGLPPVNSFWLSGCGMAQAATRPFNPHSLLATQPLLSPLSRQDHVAWQQAWQMLDETVIGPALQRVRAGQRVSLTLCGPSHAMTWSCGPGTWWSRAWAHWRARGSPRDETALLSRL